jgi:multicomponent Na+:H+ antiporter subunit C
MIALSSLVVAVLFTSAVYLMLSRNTQWIAIGFILLSNGVNLMVLTMAGLPYRAVPPLLGRGRRGWSTPTRCRRPSS